MDEEEKKQVAVFRFGVIADFVTGARLPRTERRRLLVEKCARKWTIPFSCRTHIGHSTLRDWIARYEAGGRKLEALYPLARSDSGKSRRIDEETSANLVQLRRQMPKATLTSIIEMRTGAVALVTGEIGSGKSTALRYVSESLHPAEHLCLYVTATTSSILELYRQITAALGIDNCGVSRALMLKTIRQEIIDLTWGV